MTDTKHHLIIATEDDVVAAGRLVRDIGLRQGLSDAPREGMVTAVTEVIRNALIHAGGGEMTAAAVTRDGRLGVAVIVKDRGPGIADMTSAMTDGYSTAGRLGSGLPKAESLVEDFVIESCLGMGTTVTLQQWAAPRA